MSYLGMPGNYGESFLFNGGVATMDSYGIATRTSRTPSSASPTHTSASESSRRSYLRPPYFFVHAGILPTRQLEEQHPEDMLWIRQEFIFNPHEIDAIVVFGHTPMRGVMIDLPYKLGIDTGLVYGGKLTCLEFTEGVIYQVERGAGRSGRRSRCAERPAHRLSRLRAPATFDDSRWRRSSVGQSMRLISAVS